MLQLLLQGEFTVAITLMFVIILSLTFHEFAHAAAALYLGDNTAQMNGRLNLDPRNHIDPMGLLMVATVGFGWAKPVPVTPRKLRYPWASAVVAAAGPGMNLVLAIIAANLFYWGVAYGGILASSGAQMILFWMALINLLLMLFNLIPLGPLDGHYILPWFLPKSLRYPYEQFNAKHGTVVFLILIAMSVMGVPIFRFLINFAQSIMPWLTPFA